MAASWRTTFDQPQLRSLDFMAGKPSVLAVWPTHDRVIFLDAQRGIRLGERGLSPPPTRGGEPWHQFIQALVAPNQQFMPYVRVPGGGLWLSADGRMRVIQQPDGLWLQMDGREERLTTPTDQSFTTLTLDRELGLIAALDREGKLHLYQQRLRIGSYDIGLNPELGRLRLVISQGGSALYASDGEQIVLVGSNGRVRKQLALHYEPGTLACSPDGKLLAVSEGEINMLRVYKGGDLTLSCQRFASDLLADAKRATTEISITNPTLTALGAMALSDRGGLAFALGGTVCVSSTERMSAPPRPGL